MTPWKQDENILVFMKMLGRVQDAFWVTVGNEAGSLLDGLQTEPVSTSANLASLIFP